MKIQNINFKKAFLVLLVLFALFAAVSTGVELSDGRWADAYVYEQHRAENRQGRARFGRHNEDGRRFGRHGQGRSAVNEVALEQAEVSPPNSTGDRVIYFVARHYVRITSPDFGVLSLVGLALRLAFIALVTMWVYADSKKREKNAILWAGLTAITHGLAWIVYMIVREREKRLANKK